MKIVFLAIAMLSATGSFAQKDSKIKLTRGQKITVMTNNSMDADMGMSMKNASSTKNEIIVLDATADHYTVSNTITSMNLSLDMMGQQTTYDSNNAADRDSEMGKAVSQKINKPDTLQLSALTGALINNNKKTDAVDESANPMSGMMEALGNNGDDLAVSNAFFIIPEGKKAGDSWSDSTTEKGMKIVKSYTLKSVEKDIATINLTGKTDGTTETEMQGMQLQININSKLNGEMQVNTNTSLVAKKTLTTDLTGSIEVMGQSTPITSKSTVTISYQ
jgi:hypothetical protein